MRLLLDTHFLIWLAVKPKELDRAEVTLMKRSELLISTASMIELRIKWAKFAPTRHRREDVLDPARALDYVVKNNLQLLPLTGEMCATSLDTPMGHSDPFDELLLIHAQHLGVKLLTRDTKLIGPPPPSAPSGRGPSVHRR